MTALATIPNGTPRHAPRPMSRLTEIVGSIDGLWQLATMFLESRLLPSSIDTPQKAVTIILKGDEIGIPPMLALEQITVIQGKPTISPQLMLGLIERSGQLEDLQIEETPDACTMTVTRKGRSPQVVSFTRAEAIAMGLAGKDNWKKQFGVMMYWRCGSKMGRRVFPDVIAGFYTPEELDPSIGVGEDGEIIEGEIVERPRIDPPKVKSAPGMFGEEHQKKVPKFLEWLSKGCDKHVAEWRESWEPIVEQALADGHAAPEKIADPINKHQAKNHLWKWAVQTGRIEGVEDHEGAKPAQVEAFLTSLWLEDKASIRDEMGRYVAEEKRRIEERTYRKHPDLAPAGYFANDEAAELEPASTEATPSDDAFPEGRE